MNSRIKQILLMVLASGVMAACTPTYVHIGPNWDAVHNLQESGRSFNVSVMGQSSAKVGEDLRFTVTSEKSGRLWIVQVDSADQVSLLFPYPGSSSNWVDREAPVSLPPYSGSRWKITAAEPAGPITMAFIVTDPDTDLSQVLGGPQASMSRAFTYMKTRPAWGIKHVVVNIKGGRPGHQKPGYQQQPGYQQPGNQQPVYQQPSQDVVL